MSHQSIDPHFQANFITYNLWYRLPRTSSKFLLTYKNKNRRIRLWVKMYRTLPVNGSITGNRWIRLVINIRMASYNDASGPMLTSGIT